MAGIDAWTLMGTVLGLAASAGVNLYLTTLVVGVSIRLGWIAGLPPELATLSHDWVLAAAGALYAIEFCADKIPWVDSVWDTLHTVIRPLGGAALAVFSLGSVDPVYQVLAGLAAGSVTLSTHGTKASVRVMANHSPEPFSNIALSVAEDVAVLGFAWLTMHHPILAAFLVVSFLVGFALVAPKVFRMLYAQATFVVSRITAWFGKSHTELLSHHEHALSSIRPRLSKKVVTLLEPGERLVFAVPCFSGRMRAVGRLVRGVVIGTESGKLWFVGARTLRTVSKPLPFHGCRVELRRRLLVDEILIHAVSADGIVVLRFDKTRAQLAVKLVHHLAQVGPAPIPGQGVLSAPAPRFAANAY